MANYILDLRKKVGKIPLLMCASGVIIVNESREVLLIQRADNGLWGIPGGSLELGEKMEETAVREVFEETGLTVGNIELLGIFSGKELNYVYPNGDEVFLVVSIYVSTDFTGNMVEDGIESNEVRFFNIDNLPSEIHNPDIPVWDDFIKKYNNRSIKCIFEK